MKHKTCKRMLALLLALTLLASLCACAQKQDKRPGREALEEEEEEPSPPSDAGKEADEDPQEDTGKGAPPKRPDKGGDAADVGHGDADVSGAPGTVAWTQDGAQSLALLRERICSVGASASRIISDEPLQLLTTGLPSMNTRRARRPSSVWLNTMSTLHSLPRGSFTLVHSA